MNKQRFVLILSAFLITALWRSSAVLAIQSIPPGDLLVYSVGVDNDEASTALYYPRSNQHTPFLEGHLIDALHLSVDGWLIFQSVQEPRIDSLVYLADVLKPQNAPVLFNELVSFTGYNFPQGWSPDGRFLAFTGRQPGSDSHLYLWDHQTVQDITPVELTAENMDIYLFQFEEQSWGADGKLAFMVMFEPIVEDPELDLGAIFKYFVWDGTSSIEVSKESPGLADPAVWSSDGRLAFYSEPNFNNTGIFIWDSRDGVPESAELVLAWPQDLRLPVNNLTWTNDNRLAFIARGTEGYHSRVYLWDGSTPVQPFLNATFLPDNLRESADGRWSVNGIDDSGHYLHVYDSSNHVLLKTPGQADSAWSPNGLLIFCVRYDPLEDWQLHMWNGSTVTTIAQGEHVMAQWLGGSGVDCY